MENMSEYSKKHPLTGETGVSVFAIWLIYILCSVYLYYPDFLASVLIAGFFGILACAALGFNFKYWRATVVLAASVCLLLYAIRVIRMTMMTIDLSFLSALSFYYSASWSVAAGMFQEKGMAGGLMHGFLEFIMPLLVVGTIGVTLLRFPMSPSTGVR